MPNSIGFTLAQLKATFGSRSSIFRAAALADRTQPVSHTASQPQGATRFGANDVYEPAEGRALRKDPFLPAPQRAGLDQLDRLGFGFERADTTAPDGNFSAGWVREPSRTTTARPPLRAADARRDDVAAVRWLLQAQQPAGSQVLQEATVRAALDSGIFASRFGQTKAQELLAQYFAPVQTEQVARASTTLQVGPSLTITARSECQPHVTDGRPVTDRFLDVVTVPGAVVIVREVDPKARSPRDEHEVGAKPFVDRIYRADRQGRLTIQLQRVINPAAASVPFTDVRVFDAALNPLAEVRLT